MSSRRLTIASYPGGKSNKQKHLLLYQSVPKKITTLIDPFTGLGNFFFNINDHVENVVLNDKDPDVYSLLVCIKEEELLEKLIIQIKDLQTVEKEDYYYWKNSNPTDTLERAIKLLVILNCSPNGAGGGYSYEKAHRKWYTKKSPVWKMLSKMLKKAQLLNIDYIEVFNKIIEKDFKLDFLYLDPPYFKVAVKGRLYRNFNHIDWGEFKSKLGEIECHWLLSNRDCIEIREMFPDYYQKTYNTYNDMNNKKNKNPEILISNKKLNTKC